MRISLSGGPAEEVLVGPQAFGVRCGKQDCILCEATQGHLRFFALDPFIGKGPELGRIDIEVRKRHYWDLSPNGTHVAVTDSGRIRILSLSDGRAHDLILQDSRRIVFQGARWFRDEKHLICKSEGGTLAIVGLDGHSETLWQPPLQPVGMVMPSPDGRYVAFGVASQSVNAWLAENL